MGLFIPPVSNAPTQDNFTAGVLATASIGTLITGGAANTKGSPWTELITSANFDVYGFVLVFTGSALTGNLINQLVDIGIGAAASEQVLVPDIVAGSFPTGGNGISPLFFPMYIAKGTRISARMQDAVGADTVSVGIVLYGGGDFSPPWPTFEKAVSIGTTAANSQGTVHTAGNAAFSAWASIGSTLTQDIKGFLPTMQVNNAVTVARAYVAEFGVSSTRFAGWHFITSSAEDVNQMPGIPHFQLVPSGSQMQIRAKCNAVPDTNQWGLIGFY